MKEFFESYKHLKKYPEFIDEEIRDKYKVWIESDQNSGDGYWAELPWLFNTDIAFEYVMLTYAPDSGINFKDFQIKKQRALEQSKVPKSQWGSILKNENPMIGDMITRLFRELNDFEYELIISGKEAIQSLLEVVRKPVDSRLLDDKERNAVKAKRECFDDARALMIAIKSIVSDMDKINVDLGDYTKNSVFKGGIAERLAKKAANT